MCVYLCVYEETCLYVSLYVNAFMALDMTWFC